MFGAGDLRFVVLQLISDKPSHGYEIIKSIEERLGGTYAPSPGIVYPMLTMLEEMGWASSVTEGTRKLYSITDEGSKALAEIQEDGTLAANGLRGSIHRLGAKLLGLPSCNGWTHWYFCDGEAGDRFDQCGSRGCDRRHSSRVGRRPALRAATAHAVCAWRRRLVSPSGAIRTCSCSAGSRPPQNGHV